jgi:hypothetical protein
VRVKPGSALLIGALFALVLASLALPSRVEADWKGPDAQPLFVNEANPAGYNYAPSII